MVRFFIMDINEVKVLEEAYEKLQDLKIRMGEATRQEGSPSPSSKEGIEKGVLRILRDLNQTFGVDFSEFPIRSSEMLCTNSVLEDKIWKTQEAIKHWYIKALAKEADPGIGYEVSDEDISKDFNTDVWAVRLRKGRVYEAVVTRIPDEWVSDRGADQIRRAIREGAARMLPKINRLG